MSTRWVLILRGEKEAIGIALVSSGRSILPRQAPICASIPYCGKQIQTLRNTAVRNFALGQAQEMTRADAEAKDLCLQNGAGSKTISGKKSRIAGVSELHKPKGKAAPPRPKRALQSD